MTIRNPNYKTLPDKGFKSWSDFYPFYLGEHANKTCRRLHVVGTSIIVSLPFLALYQKSFTPLYFIPLAGYGFAWFGHFFFEKNRPATFKYPIYSLISDFVMYFEIVTLKRPF
ncbi:hypothetical protein BC833DRAFT_599262 [Globomyces pollinis-pini]|nr:hypothetical protein BC833DRAFT_599262 [Globomyces pollinis-pini]